ncbi:MAG: bifunctional folylpolyglutamate synthase/dihydrofolate synthase [Chlorobi bacterium]|nr:bifunctional folylpolyglutamate synthase/dihydrofolate synthase [Chlorobiota bacterium]
MDYKETINWLFGQLPMYQRIGKAAYKADLNTTIELLRVIGNPQDSFKAVHIAGTNGKGSVSHLISSMLQEAGFKTGLYTSPHLKDFRERIKVNGQMIPEEKVRGFIEKNKAMLQKLKPSFFEMTVAMAYDYFSGREVDLAVLETGMGGRLDSTNICKPIITSVTNIGLDHTMFLGGTLEKIATEKAGIFKKNIPIVIGRKQHETSNIFNDKANMLDCAIFFSEDEIYIKTLRNRKGFNSHFDIWHNNKLFAEDISSPLAADYQIENLRTAISIALKLNDSGIEISKENILEGIKNVVYNTGFKGRWQKLADNPLTICDTGHNVDGIHAVVKQIQQLPYNSLHFILGLVSDKDADNILGLLPKTAHYYFCKPDIPRGMPEDILEQHAFKAGLKGETYSSVLQAYNSACNNSKPNDLIFIGGSTFVVAEIV